MGKNFSVVSAELGVTSSEGYVRQAQSLVESRKRERDQAKANGNYRNSKKTMGYKGKLGNGYDINVWSAEDLLKQRKEELARAKEKLREAIKAQKAMEKINKTSKVSSSSSSSSSSYGNRNYSSYTPSSSSHTTLYSRSTSSTKFTSSTSSPKPLCSSRTSSSSNSPSWFMTLLLCLFLGNFGAHRFYVGKKKTGLLQLITLGGFAIWYLIDLALILFGSFTDDDGNRIRP